MNIGNQDASKDAGVPGEAIPGNAAIPGGTLEERRSWYSRGYLPHLDQPDLCQAITFRLYDSVPSEVIQRWKEELNWRNNLPNEAETMIALRRRIIAYEDAGHGACWLGDERIASLMQDTLLHFDGQRYRLIAWCVMPNHVHVLIETFSEHSLESVLHSWKSFTASRANKLLARQGPFWAREYYDRYIRDDQHFAQTVSYIEQNPVKAGFVSTVQEWKFSSARLHG